MPAKPIITIIGAASTTFGPKVLRDIINHPQLDGSTFRSIPVHVMYEDDEVVVINYDGQIAPDDDVVQSGAFALGLALQTGTGAIDPHAGHNH